MIYCPIRGMGEKPLPLGEDFSLKNPKTEYLNPKQIRISNDLNSK